MTETDELCARVAALETVLRQLLTHLAVRSDDPPGWLATRRTLALHATQERPVDADEPTARAYAARVAQAIAGFFDQAEEVIAEYGRPTTAETQPVAVR